MKHVWIILFILINGCKEYNLIEQEFIFPEANSWYSNNNYDDHYLDKVQPILNKRCATCHGCYEAPCQLNLQSYQGVIRGYNATPVYSSKRLKSMEVTQMNDVYSLTKWQELGFLPVINEHDLESNLLEIFIEKGVQNNQPGFNFTDRFINAQNNYKNSNDAQCTATAKQFEKHFADKNPWAMQRINEYFTDKADNRDAGMGMPFGLPALNNTDMRTLRDWLNNGAKGPSKIAMQKLQTPKNPTVIKRWEKFLNTDSAQGRQAARYIYEHTYTAYFHFAESPGEYYRIARIVELNDNIGEIITKFPYQLPQGVTKFQYRLKKVTEAIVQKKMIVWPVDNKKLARLQELFFGNKWLEPVPEPEYTTSNPFAYFAAIPAEIRARFLIENSSVIIGAMVQGAVCVGSGATYAIKDHFWVWFLDPDSDVSVIYPDLGLPDSEIMSTGRWSKKDEIVKKEYEGVFRQVWNKVQGFKHDIKAVRKAFKYYERTSKDERLYQQAYEIKLRNWLKQQNRVGLTVEDIWNGTDDTAYKDGINPNAWLSITRHERSTTVQHGPEGGIPNSLWVLSFSNFERIYYNLVANYDPFGNLAMKIGSFRIMTYTRLEAEDLAISFLPIKARNTVRQRYAKGIGWIARDKLFPLLSIESSEVLLGEKENTILFVDKLSNFLLSNETNIEGRKTGTYGLYQFYEQEYDNNIITGVDEAEKLAANAGIAYLVDKTKQRLRAVSNKIYQPDSVPIAQQKWEIMIRDSLMHKTKQQDKVLYPKYFPSISYLKINTKTEPWFYSIIADRAYGYNGIPGTESLTREPELDLLTLYRGFVGAYPNVFFEIDAEQSVDFISAIQNVKNTMDWNGLVKQYGIARNSAKFWPFFDWLHEWKAKPRPGIDPILQGIIDVGQYDVVR